MPNGTYKVLIDPANGTGGVRSWHSGKSDCASADAVTVSGARSLNLTALSGSNVSGTVSSSNGPVPAGYVAFYANCQQWQNYVSTADGWFYNGSPYTVTLPNGTYKARIYPYSEGAAIPSWHSAKKDCASADTITVNGDGTRNLTAIAGYQVTGNVSSGNGPLQAASVQFYASCEDYANGDDTDSGWYAQNNPYRVTLPAGTYRVHISPEDGDTTGAFPSWHAASANCASAAVVTVGAPATIDLLAAPAPTPQPSVTPTPAPTVTPTQSPAAQSQAASFNAKKMKRKQKKALPKTTSQGAPLTWKAASKVCKVKKGKVTAVKKGKCKLKATAPAVGGFSAYVQTFTVRIT